MRSMIPRPWVLLLAAGESRRLGRPKQMARIGRESLLRRVARTALAAMPAGCIVVLGAHSARLRKELVNLPVRIVVNADWRAGLASSLRAGIAALPRSAPAALVLLADQWAIGPAELALLIAAWRRAPSAIITATSDGVRQPPAILPRRTFRQLKRLHGDEGARSVLRSRSNLVFEFEFPRAKYDLDLPAHRALLRQ